MLLLEEKNASVAPLTLTLSPWERGRSLTGTADSPLPWGEGRDRGVDRGLRDPAKRGDY